MATLSNLSSTVDSNYFDLYKSEQAINTLIAKGNIKFDKNAKTFVDIGYPYSETTGSRTGPLVAFRSIDYTNAPGDIQFFVPTTDNSKYYNLNLSNKGTLKWCNQEVVRVKSTYRSGANWYKVYDDGTIMQGGVYKTSAESATISLPTAFGNTNYSLVTSDEEASSTDTAGVDVNNMISNKTTTSFRVSKVKARYLNWFAVGIAP